MHTKSPAFPRTLRLGIILALAVAYLLQAAPHGHVDDAHAQDHAAAHAPAHADHAHAPAAGADADDSPATGHHHHAVSRHLDLHSVRHGLLTAGQDHAQATALAVAVEPLPGSCRCGFTAGQPAEPAPDEPLLRHAPPRAPPA
ncbi:MAG: hypothetical protein IH621_07165 [Krumholzibacteria bacterium]|nr:hypothetical protein [Candidatus Krumholzibacteria bacterium]